MERLRDYWRLNNFEVNKKLEIIRVKMNSLIARETDVRIEIENAEMCPGKIRRMEVVHWLHTVDEKKSQLQNIEKEVSKLWLISSHSVSQLSVSIERVTADVKELLELGAFPNGLVLDDHKSRSLAFPVTELVGAMFQKNMEIMRGWLESPLPSLMGVYGMGGVGKTTLLKHIHNYLLANSDIVERVLWVTVSHDWSVYKLQQKIAYAVTDEKDFNEEDEERRAVMLHKILGKMQKTVLILDDLWEPFMLDRVGIIPGESTCKIIMSSRSLEVCRRMGCGDFVVQVKTLGENEVWKLFADCLLNYEALATEVKQIAALVAEECSGLPLAIVTIAASMRGVLSIHEWQNSLDELRNPNRRQHDMENDVLLKLKFSYDRLNDEMLKSCFLSCVLYSKEYYIPREEIIDLWIGEGLFDDIHSKQEQQNKGHTILNKLENSCLLESITYMAEKCVNLHYLVRDMGISITRSHPRFMVKSGLLLKGVPEEQYWAEDLVKVSLRENQIEKLPCDMSPKCPKLVVLMLCNNPLRAIPESFFVHMRALTFLDLSWTGIERLPESVSYLENLRAILLHNCHALRYVPSVVMHTRLRVLDLPNNGRSLKTPDGMEKLKCLEQLTHCCWNISYLTDFNKLIESCSRLCCYNFWLYDRDVDGMAIKNFVDKKVLISGVEFGEKTIVLLPGTIQVLDMHECDFKGRKTLGDVFPSLGAAKELKELHMSRCRGLRYISSAPQQDSSICPQLYTLVSLGLYDLRQLRGLTQIGGMFFHLKELNICKCPKIKVVFQVNLLQQYQPLLPNLVLIELTECEELEEITESGRVSNTLALAPPKLRELSLNNLPKLCNIYSGQLLHCTYLEHVSVQRCATMKVVFQGNLQQQHLLPYLDKISVTDCEELEEVIESGGGTSRHALALPKLRILQLFSLPKLVRIYRGRLLCTFLKDVSVYRCAKLKVVFQGDLLQQHLLPNLEKLSITDCEELEEIIEEQGSNSSTSTLALPKLRILQLFSLPKLGSIYKGQLVCTCLKDVSVYRCAKLKVMFQGNLQQQQQQLFPNLENIFAYNCEELEEIIEPCRGTCTPTLALPKLRILQLLSLPKLVRVHRGLLICPRAKTVTYRGCPKLDLLPLSKQFVCDTSPSTLASIPTFADSPEWWETLRRDYPDDGRTFSLFLHKYLKSQALDPARKRKWGVSLSLSTSFTQM